LAGKNGIIQRWSTINSCERITELRDGADMPSRRGHEPLDRYHEVNEMPDLDGLAGRAGL
jgi:hypothetical protein